MNRRQFVIRTGMTAAGYAAGGLLTNRASADPAAAGAGRGVAIVAEPGDAIVAARSVGWATGELSRALAAKGFMVHSCTRLDQAAPGDLAIVLAGPSSAAARAAGAAVPPDAEGLTLAPAVLGGRDVLLACGGGARGLVYALLEIADAVSAAADPQAVLRPAQAVVDAPANAVRSVMRPFVSDVEDPAWYHDRDFWRRYLSMLAAQRFNRFNLALGLGYDAPNRLRDTYFYFAYPFLLSVPGYHVRATNLSEAERDRNMEMLRFISDEAALRGLDFQLGLWTHAYTWTNSPTANHNIEGLTPQTQATYSRDALALLLQQCPGITGVTFRIHGESGVPEGSYDLWRTVFDGCVRSGRPVGIDMHAKGMDQATIDVALGTGLPITISPKFSSEHMGLPYHQAAIRAKEMPTRSQGTGPYAQSEGARSFLRYSYGDLLTEDRRYGIVHRVWPGTQRLLLWGDPAFAAGYSRAAGFCGTQGCEIFEPLSFKGREGSGLPGHRDAYADPTLQPPGGDFEKYLCTYSQWGRLLYNPQANPQAWRRQFNREFGPAAAAAEVVLRHASRILPILTSAHLPSASNNSFWPEMYANMGILADSLQPYSDTPAPKRFGTVSPLDPQLFSRIDDHADALLQDQVDGKYSPVEVAQWLEDLAHSTGEHLAETEAAAADRAAPALRRLALDVQVQGGLGRFFGQKLRAGVLYALYERTGDRGALDAALASYRAAREAWAKIAELTTGAYVADVSYGDGPFKRGHWSARLADIDRDIAAMEQAPAPAAPAQVPSPEKIAALVRGALGHPQRPAPAATHVPPPPFRRGQPVALALSFAPEQARPVGIRLHYRRVNQAEAWQAVDMKPATAAWHGEVPAAYTDSKFPLQYYFEPTNEAGVSWVHPGLGSALARPPYLVLRQARA
jgi:hypothetical protein